MPYYADRTSDLTTTVGTGSITLAGTPPTGYQSFATAFTGLGSTPTEYCIVGGAEWEIGHGTFNGTTTLTRDKVTASSNSNNLVSFSAGTKTVFCTHSASEIENSIIGNQAATRSAWNML